MLVVQQTYPAWILGIVTAAGVLAGLVPAAGQLLAAASIVGKNVLADYGIARGDAAQTLATRILVLIVALLAFGFWALAHTTLVGLLLIGYNGITQLFPGVVLGVGNRRPSAFAVGAGLVAGLLVLIVFAIEGIGQVDGINGGVVALAANIAVLAIASALVPARHTAPAPLPEA
jgi:SSS family solute:Na+ symporter